MNRAQAVLAMVLVLGAGAAFSGGSAEELTPERTAEGYYQVATMDMTFEWKVVGDRLEVGISAPTTGWIAVAFDPSTGMKDANTIIGFVRNGTAQMEDHFGTSPSAHQSDVSLGGSRDLSDVSGTESGGTTELRFSIPLDSGDRYDRPLVQGETYTINLAYGSNGADSFTPYHGRARTQIQVELN